MNKNNIGTHNSMTYLPVRKWWMKPLNLIAKCQSRPIAEQVKDVDCIDLRVYLRGMSWEFAHGLVEYKSDYTVYEIVDLAADNGVKYIRLTLEKGGELEEAKFCALCSNLEVRYPQITFLNGRAKKGWRLLYKFRDEDSVTLEQYCSSMDGKGLYRIFPKLYAWRYNKRRMQQRNPESICLFDFI
jgi:hypothetical protein